MCSEERSRFLHCQRKRWVIKHDKARSKFIVDRERRQSQRNFGQGACRPGKAWPPRLMIGAAKDRQRTLDQRPRTSHHGMTHLFPLSGESKCRPVKRMGGLVPGPALFDDA